MAQTRRSAAIEDLRALIDREYPPGSQLPAEGELALELGVSRNTLREAVGELALSGLVERRWGNGTFVSARDGAFHLNLTDITAPLRQQVESAGHVATMHKASAVKQRAGEHGEILGLEPGDEIWHLERTIAIDGVPAVLLLENIPTAINGKQLDLSGIDDIGAEVMTMLQRQVNARIARMEGRLLGVTADAILAARFGVEPAHPLLLFDKVSLTDRGQTVAAAKIYYRTDAIAVHVASLVRTL